METKKVVKEEKVWGIYNTLGDPNFAEKLDEVDIWKKIDNLGTAIYFAERDQGAPWCKVTPDQLLDAKYNLEYLIYSTKRFGVEFDMVPSENEHVERSSSYLTWYYFWYNHFDSMSKEEYDQFVNDKFTGNDISKYMPQGSWKDLPEGFFKP